MLFLQILPIFSFFKSKSYRINKNNRKMNSKFSLVALTLACLLSIVASQSRDSVDIEANTQVVPTPPGGFNTGLKEVYRSKSCGGVSKLLQFRRENCETGVPCVLVGSGNPREGRSEVDFIASENVNQLGLRIMLSLGGAPAAVVYEEPLANSSVQAGRRYTIIGYGQPSQELRGMSFEVQYLLYRVEDVFKTIEVCAQGIFSVRGVDEPTNPTTTTTTTTTRPIIQPGVSTVGQRVFVQPGQQVFVQPGQQTLLYPGQKIYPYGQRNLIFNAQKPAGYPIHAALQNRYRYWNRSK